MQRRFLPLTVLMLLLCFNSEAVWGQNDSDTLYDVYIGDIGFNESRDSITGDFITGHVSYNSDTHTLTLQDATVSELIQFWGSHYVKLKLIGDNYIERLYISPDSCAIIGPGYLRVGNEAVGTAIEAPITTFLYLTEGGTLDIVARDKGITTLYDYIFDDYLRYPLFIIYNSSLSITAPICYDIIQNWWLVGSRVVSPADVYYNPSTYSLEQNGEAVFFLHNHLEIQSYVGLQDINKSEMRIYGISGGIRVCSHKQPDQNVEVMNMLGQTLYCRPLQCDEDFIPIRSGIYIVRVGKTTEKVIVR